MARSKTATRSTRRKSSPTCEISSSVLQALIARAGTEEGLSHRPLLNLAHEPDTEGTLLVDSQTAKTLLKYSNGEYKSCKESGCDNVLTVTEAIRGLLSCANHREAARLDALKRRKRSTANFKELLEAKVRP